jgi:hypothetical protein
MYHVLPHRFLEDWSREGERLEWAREHSNLASAEQEAKRLCSIGWSAHIWEDADPRTFVSSWQPGPNGPVQDPRVHIQWGDEAYPIVTEWTNQ